MKNDSIDFDQCNCSCHNDSSIEHCLPCCIKCDICGKDIKKSLYNLHVKNCKSKNNEKTIDFIKNILKIRS